MLMTRVREPLDYYLSFYKWGVAFRQREDPVRASHARPLAHDERTTGRDAAAFARGASRSWTRAVGVCGRVRAQASFGKDFLEWAERVPNLQSTMMMQSMAAMAAEYHVAQVTPPITPRSSALSPTRAAGSHLHTHTASLQSG